MPRQARLDIPILLQHVIVRGIERSNIFLDDDDRDRFVDRFSNLLVETGTDCFAWALIPNHAHLLLRCNHFDLSRFDGVAMGKRPELVGVGLHRSQMLKSNGALSGDYDERVLRWG